MFDFYFLAEESEDGFFLTEQPRKKSKTPSKLPPTSPKDGRKSPILTQKKDAAVAEQQQLTTQSQAGDTDSKKHEKEKHQWDEYLLSILSRPTAQWIVTQRTDPGDKRYKVRLNINSSLGQL